MGLSFNGTRLTNASPPPTITGTVTLFTVAGWVYPTITNAADQTFWSLSDTAGTANWFRFSQLATTDVWRFGRRDTGGGEQRADCATAATLNAWSFFVCRAITATNIRLSIRHPSGLIEHAQNTTSRSPAGIDSLQLGCLQTTSVTESIAGVVGELWYTDIDIQGDGAQLNNDFMHQLAFGGPFSVPHVAASLLEYRSLRAGLDSKDDSAEEIYAGKAGWQTWAGSGVLSHHPPLPYWYKKPNQASQIAVF